MILLNYLKYGLRDTLRSLWRHKGMVAVTILTVAITFVVLGGTILLSMNSQYIEEHLEQQMEIVVFLNDDVTREEALGMIDEIKALEGFSEYAFVPKEEALESMGDRFNNETGLINALGGVNPLPDAYHIKVESLEYMETAAEKLGAMEEVYMVRYGQDTVTNMAKISTALWFGCTVIIIAMAVAALILVNSTIRLTVSARHEEIEIMKYIGATNLYVRMPFVIEGLILGIFGALIAIVVLFFGYHAVVGYIIENIAFLPIIRESTIVLKIGLWMVLGGALLGALGSNIAARKYLKV